MKVNKWQNLKDHWFDHLLHVGISGTAMALAVTVNPICGLIFAGCIARQTVGFWEKRDTASLDLAYIIAGALIGSIVGCVIVIQ